MEFKDRKRRINELRRLRILEFINGNIFLYVLGELQMLYGNRYGDRLFIINKKISNLRHGLDEDYGRDYLYSEPGITDDQRLFPKVKKK